MKRLKDSRGDVSQPIQAEGWIAKDLAEQITDIAKQYGIPAIVQVDEVTTGGLFGQTFPCVVISHPNPPQPYFEQWVVINRNIINFYYGGYSAANTSMNKREMNANSGKLSGLLKNALSSDKSMELQTEQMWHGQIMSIYKKIWFPEQ